MQEAIEIKVLAGIHAGAKVSAGPGRAVIGSADDCDILIAVDDVAPRHAALAVGGDGVTVVPLEGEVILADGTLVRDGTPLAAFVPFGIGSAILAHAPAGAAWPRIDLLTFGRTPPEPVAETVPAGAGGTAGRQEEPGNRTAPPPAGRADPSEGAARSSALRQRSLYPLAALLLIGIAFIGTTWFRNEAGNQAQAGAVGAPPAPPTPLERITARIGEMGLADRLEARPLGAQAVMVTGYVGTAAEREAASARLPVDDVPLSLRIWSQDELLETARNRLADFPDAVAVSPAEPGILRLSGLVADGDRRSRILAAMREDVPGVRDVVDDTITREEGLARLRAAIADSPLARRVTVSSDGREFVAHGSLGEAGLSAWRDLMGSLEPMLGDGLAVRTAFVPRSDDLPFVIRSVVTGPLPYIVTSEGKRIGEGGRLAEGFELVSIDDGKITIRHGDQTFVQRSREE